MSFHCLAPYLISSVWLLFYKTNSLLTWNEIILSSRVNGDEMSPNLSTTFFSIVPACTHVCRYLTILLIIKMVRKARSSLLLGRRYSLARLPPEPNQKSYQRYQRLLYQRFTIFMFTTRKTKKPDNNSC